MPMLCRCSQVTVKRGDWVRLKRGINKGDLAQVLMTADQGTQITVKIIPRIDYVKLGSQDKPSTQRAFSGLTVMSVRSNRLPQLISWTVLRSDHFSLKSRPAPRLMNPAELRDLGEYLERRQEPMTQANCVFFGNNFYKNGFLYKTMKVVDVDFCSRVVIVVESALDRSAT